MKTYYVRLVENYTYKHGATILITDKRKLALECANALASVFGEGIQNTFKASDLKRNVKRLEWNNSGRSAFVEIEVKSV